MDKLIIEEILLEAKKEIRKVTKGSVPDSLNSVTVISVLDLTEVENFGYLKISLLFLGHITLEIKINKEYKEDLEFIKLVMLRDLSLMIQRQKYIFGELTNEIIKYQNRLAVNWEAKKGGQDANKNKDK